jgi:hypothetical protein
MNKKAVLQESIRDGRTCGKGLPYKAGQEAANHRMNPAPRQSR